MNLFDQVTRTKIVLPRRRPDLLSRQRLLDLLLDLLEYKLVIMAAPAGYGKTSLLLDMAHATTLPVCWYSLDALDRDPQRFTTHFVACIAHRFPRFGQRSWATLQSGVATDADLDRLTTIIVNEAYERIREHFILVLDDYHFVDDSEEIDHFINQFIQQVDENCHIVISSRTLLTLPDLPLMVGRSQVSGLSFDELAFRAGEIQSLFLQNYRQPISDTTAEQLTAQTEGWITGLLLSTQVLQKNIPGPYAEHPSGVGLYDYLAQQVLDQQPAVVRDFLLRTSLLEEFDAELCQDVFGPASYQTGEAWQDLVGMVLRQNLFVLPVGDRGSWLRYHHLFRDFLQARLTQERPEEKAHILRRAAHVYAQRGEWERAHELYLQLGDLEAAADLIETAGLSLVKRGRLLALERWLDALPPGLLVSRPGLLALRGVVAVDLGKVDTGLSLQNQAEAAFRAAGDQPNLARTLAHRAVPQRLLGRYQASLADAEEALALSQDDQNLADARAEALRAKGMSLYHLGQLDEAIHWLQESLAAYHAIDDQQRGAMLLMELGMACERAGRYDLAATHHNRALSHWRQIENVVQQANLLNNLGVVYHLKGDYEQALALLEEALVCARQSGYTRLEAAALASIGDLYANLEASDAASIAYRQAQEIAAHIQERFLLVYLSLVEAACARLKGELGLAHELLGEAEELATQSGSTYEQGLYHLESGQLALAQHNPSAAITHLGKAARCFDDGGQRVEATRAHLYLAQAYRAGRDERSTSEHLQRALQLAAELESHHTLVVAARDAKELLADYEHHAMLGRPASRLLHEVVRFERNIPGWRRRLRQQAKLAPLASPKLTIQAMGRAQVSVEGKLVSNAAWQGQAARELFFYLLTQSDGLTKESVGSLFWPECSSAEVKLKFKNAIYRLRQAVGPEVVVFDEDRYYFDRGLDYEYDVETFWARLARAEKVKANSERIAAYQNAVQAYGGPYLPEVGADWASWERERLKQAYLEAVLRLAELCLETEDYRPALDYCQLVLAEDDCLEEAHRLAMRAHAALGNRAAVVRQYERCRQALLSEVSMPPSSQTTALFEMLTR